MVPGIKNDESVSNTERGCGESQHLNIARGRVLCVTWLRHRIQQYNILQLVFGLFTPVQGRRGKGPRAEHGHYLFFVQLCRAATGSPGITHKVHHFLRYGVL
jgi:hypothetical protein